MFRRSVKTIVLALSAMMLCLLSLLFNLGGSALAAPPPGCPENITNYWWLDEAAGTTFADSVGSVSATCVNCPTATTGIKGGAQLFNGTSQVDAAGNSLFDWGAADSFSVEAWVKTDVGSTCSGNQVMVGRNDGTNYLQWWVGCWDTAGQAAFVLIDKSGNSAILSGARALTDGLWHHIAAVRDGGTGDVSLYVDGVKEDSTTITYTDGFDSATAALNIGWLDRDAGYHFAGAIDEVALYGRALTGTEILSHYYLSRGYCDMCATPVKIMPAGDSITEGNNDLITDPNYMASYRQKLYLDLKGSGYDFDFVGSLHSGGSLLPAFDIDHEGHAGYMAAGPYGSGEVVNDIYNWLAANPADVVLLHIGTNDVYNNGADANEIAAILDEIDRYNQKVTVALALIINEKPVTTAVTDYNNAVLAMAQNRIASGDKIIIVDEESALTYPDDMNGTLHPTQAGYDKMAGPWFSALKDFLPVCKVVAPLFISTPIIISPRGHPYVYDADANGNPSPLYSLNTSVTPAWLNIDEITGITSGTPVASGVYNVEIKATNSEGFATQSYTLNVVDCPSDMSHYWRFDEPDGPPYKDIYGNDATCTDCPSTTTGIIGAAKLYTETSQVDAPNDNTFDWGSGDSFTVEVWMKTAAGSTCSGTQVIAGRSDSASQLQWWVGCWDTAGEAAFVLIDKSGTSSAILAGTKALTDGLWHHIAAVRDAGTNEVSLYVDGVKEDSTTAMYTDGFDSSTAALNIGWLNRDAGYHFAGGIDEVAVYHRTLSDDEIYQHYTYETANVGYCEDIAPKIVSSPVTTAVSGVLYAYDVNAMGNPKPTYNLSLTPVVPSGMSINSTSGLIEWTPSSAGDFNIIVQAINGIGPPDTQSFSIHVDASIAPTITTAPVTKLFADKPYKYDVNATGNPAPTYSLITYPTDMTINSTTGLIQWTAAVPGDVNVTVRASNVAGYVEQNFIISVAVVPPLPGGMSHYWTLDETGTSPYKDLYGINDATCVNCPTATTGIIGGAQQFMATNQVDAADDNTFDWGTGDSFTVEGWMKTAAGSTCSGEQVIAGRSDSASHLQWWVGCWDTTGKAAFVLIDKSATSSAILSGTKALTDGLWHHIAVVRDAGTNEVRLYVDGVKEDSTTITYTDGFDSSTAALNIGWLNRAAGYHFVGAIDEVALYNRALSGVEVLQHYTYGQGGNGYSDGLSVKRIGSTTEYYSVLQAAYDGASNVNTIQSQNITFNEDLVFDLDITATLRGGYDSAWSFHSDYYTTVSGSVTINKGTLILENLIVR